MKMVLASKNPHKLTEMKAILSQLGVEVVLESDVGVDVDVEETGETELKREAEQKAVSLEKIADYALEAGVNCVLLPESMEPKSIERMEKALGTEAQAMGDYYLLFVRT